MGGEILDRRRRGARDEDGIFQVRVLEWIAISYYRGYSCPRD